MLNILMSEQLMKYSNERVCLNVVFVERDIIQISEIT